jgi:hypothetical protein
MAGNWGPSKLFTYKFKEYVIRPTVQTVQINKGILVPSPDGVYLCAGKSIVITAEFSEDMKPDTAKSTNSVILRGILSNLNEQKNVSFDLIPSYTSTNRTLTLNLSQPLILGWLYEVIFTTAITDLGGNPLSQENNKVLFQTVMDPSVDNKVTSGQTAVEIPANALPVPASVGIGVIAGGASQAPPGPKGAVGWHSPMFASAFSIATANSKIKSILGPFAQPVTLREFIAVKEDSSFFTSNFNKAATITLPYTDNDNDGYVDGVNPRVRVQDLQVFVLDETLQTWNKLSGVSVNSSAKTVTANAMHFSIYAVFGSAHTDVSNVYAYPNPFKPSDPSHKKITFAALPDFGTIRIYTVSGELAQKIDFLNQVNNKYEWPVTNFSGEALASDVYIYIVESGPNKKTGKLMVIR